MIIWAAALCSGAGAMQHVFCTASLSLQKAPTAPRSVPCIEHVSHLLFHFSALWDSSLPLTYLDTLHRFSYNQGRGSPSVLFQCTVLGIFNDWVLGEVGAQVHAWTARGGEFNTTSRLQQSSYLPHSLPRPCLDFCCLVFVLELVQEKLFSGQIHHSDLVAVRCFFSLDGLLQRLHFYYRLDKIK